MKKSTVRTALFSSATFFIPAIPASLMLPAQAAAQATTCSVVATTATEQEIECEDGGDQVAVGTTDLTTTVTPGAGLRTSSTVDQTTTLTPGADGDTIATTATSAAVLQSDGTLTFNAGDVNFSTEGGIAADAVVLSGAGVSATLGNILTDGNNAWGVNASSTGALSVSVGNITTLGDNYSTGIFAQSTGAMAITCGNLATTGDGLLLTSGTAVTVNCGDITATGDDYSGLTVTAGTDADITVADISTDGDMATGIEIDAVGDITLVAGDVTTAGDDSTGIDLVSTGGGNIDVTAQSISTAGINSLGLSADTDGAITAAIGDIATQGDNSIGALVNGGVGAIDVQFGNVTTAGADSTAVDVTGAGDITVATGNLTTSGDNSWGLSVEGTGAGSAVDVTFGNVATEGFDAAGVVVVGSGPTTVAGGNISTQGDSADAFIAVSDEDATVMVGNLSTAGDNAVGAIVVAGGDADVTTGNITTAGVNGHGLIVVAENIDATFGNVTATGQGSNGVIMVADGGAGDIAVAGGNISVASDFDAAAILVGNVSGTLGNIVSSGEGGVGLLIGGGVDGLTVGNVTTSSSGVMVFAGAEDVTLTTGNVTTSEDLAPAVTINTTGEVTYAGGVLTTTGEESIGLDINGGVGPITATIAGASTAGDDSDAVQISGAGAVAFTNTGTITTTGVGSNAIDIAAGTTASVNCGNASTTADGTPAVVVVASGDTNVTCGTVTTTGAASDAIVVTNTAGTTTVTGGTTSATGLGSSGIVVTSSSDGLVTVNTGAVTANDDAVVATSTGGGNVIVNATGNVTSTTGTGIVAATDGDATVTVAATRTVQGLTAGIDVTSGGTTTMTINGIVQSTTGAGPAIVATGGPAAITIGTTGRINGRMTLTAGNDTVVNNGVYNAIGITDFGAGADVFTNSATGTVLVTNGTATFANLETFNNAGGLIDMRDGAANDVFNISGNYNATGNARLGIDLGAIGNALTADLLNIGGNTTGTTNVLINLLPGTAVIDPDGVRIVDAAGGTGIFTGSANAGLIDYNVVMQGPDAFVMSTPNARILDVAVAGSVGQDMWYQSADAYSAVAAMRRGDFGTERSTPVGFWAQLYGSSDRYGNREASQTVFGTALEANQRIRTTRRGAQVGIDFGPANGSFVAGVTGGYGHAKSRFSSGSGTRLHAEGYNYGAYAQFGMAQGVYGGLLIKRDEYDLDLTNGAFFEARPEGRSTGIEGEVGYRFGGDIAFDVNAGLAHVRTRIDDFVAGNIAFDPDRTTSTRGRLGARATFGSQGWAPFVDAKLLHEFKGESEFGVASGTLSDSIAAEGRGTWVRLEAGIGGGSGPGPLLTLWGDFGDVRGWGVRGGFRF
ncbi:MAG TPA: hypothetical protein VNH53_01785 [Sphingomicrobium sp.]|nr:hypothetical protein [Sphingomicrobium sp.]